MTGNDAAEPLRPRIEVLLSAWAASQRLDQQQANAIRAAIVAEPKALHPVAELDAQWWLDLAGQTNRVIARSMRRQPFPRMPRPLPLAS